MIVATPGATPVTRPVDKPTVAVPVALLVQVPEPMRSLRLMEDPAQTLDAPKIAVGAGFTVTTAVITQPVASVNVMILVPAATPVTTPEDSPTVATPVLPLIQVPEPLTSDNVVSGSGTWISGNTGVTADPGAGATDIR